MPQTPFTTEMHLCEGLNFVQRRTSNFEMSLADSEGTSKLTESEMNEQLYLLLGTLMRCKASRNRRPDYSIERFNLTNMSLYLLLQLRIFLIITNEDGSVNMVEFQASLAY
jgi:hypothetical protein